MKDLCFAFQMGRCAALSVRRCDAPNACAFFKTAEQADADRERVEKALRKRDYDAWSQYHAKELKDE